MKIVFIFLLLVSSLSSFEQSIRYVVAAPNAVHHEAEISVAADKLPAGPVLFRMSRSSPGRYATHEFGKNVYNVKAFDASGKLLTVEKTEPDVYRVSGHKGTVKVTYTLFANHPDGTYAGVDVTGLHLNMPAAFMWVKGKEKTPITIQFVPLDKEWKVATQLKPTDDAFTFTAPGLQYFMDSPTKVGNLQFRQWTETNPDQKTYTFRLALEADAPAAAIDSFANNLQKIVRQAMAVFGELPAYDYGTYTFIASINPYVRGDGMEHRNSTMISIPAIFDGSNRLLGVFAHEFFHCWNVERLRPFQLEPFNFEKANMSEGLWVAEGFTQYYGDLLLARAGLMSEPDFLTEMTGLVNTKMNIPGAQDYSPIENSQRAVFVDAGVSVDRANYANMYASYYTYGGALALALDLDLRSKFKNLSLDDLMRAMWKRHGKPEKPYSMYDLQKALAGISSENYASTFFRNYVFGHEPFDYRTAFSPANLDLVPVDSGKAWIGNFSFVAGRKDLMLTRNTIKHTPLYNAGVDFEDVLVTLDGKNLAQGKDIDNILADHKPGDRLTLVYKHQDVPVTAELQLVQNPAVQLVPRETLQVDKNAEKFKREWMGEKGIQPSAVSYRRGSYN
jgi:predicted metalloprotease with PDZ domain